MISSDNIQTSPEKVHIAHDDTNDDHQDDHYSIDDMRDEPHSPALPDIHNTSCSPSSASSLRKRSRTVLTPFQTRYLQSVLEKTYFPTQIQRDEISRAINVPSRTVQIWFQNQRQKAKQMQLQQKASGEGPQHRQSLQSLLNMPQKDFQSTLQQMLHQMGQSRAQEIRDMAQNLYHINHLSQMTPAMFLNILHIQQQGIPAPSLFQQQKLYKPSPIYRDNGESVVLNQGHSPHMTNGSFARDERAYSRIHGDSNGHSPCPYKSVQLPPPRLFSPLSAPSIPGGGFHDELPSLRSLIAAALTCVPPWEQQSQEWDGKDGTYPANEHHGDSDGLSILVNAAVKSGKSPSPDNFAIKHHNSPKLSPTIARVPSISPRSSHNTNIQRSPYQRPLKLKSPEMSRKNEEFLLGKTMLSRTGKSEARDNSNVNADMILFDKSSTDHGGTSSTCYLSPESEGLDQQTGDSIHLHHSLPTFSPEGIRAVYSEPCSPSRILATPIPENEEAFKQYHQPPRSRTPYEPQQSRQRYQRRSMTLLEPL